MRSPRFGGIFGGAGVLAALVAAPGAVSSSTDELKAAPARPLPLVFERNAGQARSGVRFMARGARFRLFLTDADAVVVFGRASSRGRGSVLRLRFVGARAHPRVLAVGRTVGRAVVVSERRRVVAPTYRAVAYRGLYPGIDLIYDGSRGLLEYRLAVVAGADPSRIRLALRGPTKRRLTPVGELVLRLPGLGDVHAARPAAYQRIAGRNRPVKVGYVLAPRGEVRFRLGRYDRRRPLVIDPQIRHTATLGEGSGSFANAVAVDRQGNSYVAGYLARAEFPEEDGDFEAPPRNGLGFVAKLGVGGEPLFTTYFDGPGDDVAAAVAVDHDGAIYAAGATDWESLRSDAFVTRLDGEGRPLWTTTLGGSGIDDATGIAVDSEGRPYVVGHTTSADFPATSTGFTRGPASVDAFVARLSPDGAVDWAAALGGDGEEDVRGIGVDASGSAHIAGATDTGLSPGRTLFPTTPGAAQPSPGGGYDAFVTKFSPDGSQLVYSTLLGGTNTDRASAIAVDALGHATVTGGTTDEFPTTPGAFSRTPDPYTTEWDVFVTRLDPAGGTLLYSTLIAGDGTDYGSGVGVDASGRAWVTGWTWSANLPVTASAFQNAYAGGGDAFVTALEPDGDRLSYSTFLGGTAQEQGNAIALGADGSVYPAGITLSPDFPGALRTGYDPVWAAYVLRLAPGS